MAGKWIQKAEEGMEAKGSKGSFGKATAKKIAAGKRAGGVMEKKAVLAESFKKMAHKKKVGGK